MRAHPTIEDDACFVDVEQSEQLKAGIISRDDSCQYDYPSLDQESREEQYCSSSSIHHGNFLVEVFELLPKAISI